MAFWLFLQISNHKWKFLHTQSAHAFILCSYKEWMCFLFVGFCFQQFLKIFLLWLIDFLIEYLCVFYVICVSLCIFSCLGPCEVLHFKNNYRSLVRALGLRAFGVGPFVGGGFLYKLILEKNTLFGPPPRIGSDGSPQRPSGGGLGGLHQWLGPRPPTSLIRPC